MYKDKEKGKKNRREYAYKYRRTFKYKKYKLKYDNKPEVKKRRKEYNKKYCKTIKYKLIKNEYKRKRYNILRKSIIELYGGVCACCKESIIQFLTIDHIDGGGRREIIKYKNAVNFYIYLFK